MIRDTSIHADRFCELGEVRLKALHCKIIIIGALLIDIISSLMKENIISSQGMPANRMVRLKC